MVMAQFLHAVEHTVSPGRLIPIDPQRWIAIAILGNEYVGSHARHSFHQLPDAIHAPIPFGIELVLIQTEPGLERREATDHFFLSDFHRPAHGSLPRTGIQQRRLDQILSAEKQTAALWSAQSLAAREAVEINSHLRVELGIVDGRDPGCVIQQHGNLVLLRNRQFSLEFFPEIGGVDHGGVFADRVNEFFRGESENQLCASQADGAVECAPSSHHDHFMLQPGRIGKLPDVLVIGAGHARGRGGCHRARGARSDESGFRARQFR